mmetsp:Transcript_44961/g.59663  ORF Transcript_44961/g.59663 Transcript_44961/m.59663 type:complete len:231 (-) Transcript_44961:894-1586(-)
MGMRPRDLSGVAADKGAAGSLASPVGLSCIGLLSANRSSVMALEDATFLDRSCGAAPRRCHTTSTAAAAPSTKQPATTMMMVVVGKPSSSQFSVHGAGGMTAGSTTVVSLRDGTAMAGTPSSSTPTSNAPVCTSSTMRSPIAPIRSYCASWSSGSTAVGATSMISDSTATEPACTDTIRIWLSSISRSVARLEMNSSAKNSSMEMARTTLSWILGVLTMSYRELPPRRVK